MTTNECIDNYLNRFHVTDFSIHFSHITIDLKLENQNENRNHKKYRHLVFTTLIKIHTKQNNKKNLYLTLSIFVSNSSFTSYRLWTSIMCRLRLLWLANLLLQCGHTGGGGGSTGA